MASPSVLKGLITNEGLSQSVVALQSSGWKIYPTGFAVSDEMGDINVNRTIVSLKPTWYKAPISGRIVKSANTIEFLCTVPPGVSADVMGIKEIYIIAETEDGTEFLLAINGIEGDVTYDPAGSTKFRVMITIQNVDLMDLYVFKYTQAMEIEDHNNDPNAHPDLLSAIINVANPVAITNNYMADQGDTIFADSSNGEIEITLPATDLRIGSRVTIYDVGWKCDVEGCEITVVAPGFLIDKRDTTFYLNFKGGAVNFIYNPQYTSWMVDIAGRYYMNAGKEPSEVLYPQIKYTEFLDSSWLTFGGSPIIVDEDNTNYPSLSGNTLFVDTTEQEIIILLPEDPSPGYRVQVIDSKNNFDINNAIAKGQGNKIFGSLNDFRMTIKGGIYNFLWDSLADEWRVTATTSFGTGGEDGGGGSDGSAGTIWNKSSVLKAVTLSQDYTAIVPKTGNTESIGTDERRYNAGFFKDLTVTNVIQGTAYRSWLGDLAEYYYAGELAKELIPGTVVSLNTEETSDIEVKKASRIKDPIIGVVSTAPGFILNSPINNPNIDDESLWVAVGIKGRIPVRLTGKVRKGDKIVLSEDGVARRANGDELFHAFGYSMETKTTSEEDIILAFIK